MDYNMGETTLPSDKKWDLGRNWGVFDGVCVIGVCLMGSSTGDNSIMSCDAEYIKQVSPNIVF